ncbi:hypothetical protein [Oceanobacillus rekensis]|nr:hypothetical protein [Oceanobacillus rekensis]
MVDKRETGKAKELKQNINKRNKHHTAETIQSEKMRFKNADKIYE